MPRNLCQEFYFILAEHVFYAHYTDNIYASVYRILEPIFFLSTPAPAKRKTVPANIVSPAPALALKSRSCARLVTPSRRGVRRISEGGAHLTTTPPPEFCAPPKGRAIFLKTLSILLKLDKKFF